MITTEGEVQLVGMQGTVAGQLGNIWGQTRFSMPQKDSWIYLKGALPWVDHSPFPVPLEGGNNIHP